VTHGEGDGGSWGYGFDVLYPLFALAVIVVYVAIRRVVLSWRALTGGDGR